MNRRIVIIIAVALGVVCIAGFFMRYNPIVTQPRRVTRWDIAPPPENYCLGVQSRSSWCAGNIDMSTAVVSKVTMRESLVSSNGLVFQMFVPLRPTGWKEAFIWLSVSNASDESVIYKMHDPFHGFRGEVRSGFGYCQFPFTLNSSYRSLPDLRKDYALSEGSTGVIEAGGVLYMRKSLAFATNGSMGSSGSYTVKVSWDNCWDSGPLVTNSIHLELTDKIVIERD